MMTHKEIHDFLPDYALGLLAPGVAQEVAEHLVGCASCRQAVRDERELAALVRATLAIATRPDEARLRTLMPALPKKAKHKSTSWAVRLAPALVVMFLIVGGILAYAPYSERPVPLFVAATATATSTKTPTATIALESGEGSVQTPFIPAAPPFEIPAPLVASPNPDFVAPALPEPAEGPSTPAATAGTEVAR